MFSFARWQHYCAVRLKISKFAHSDSTFLIAHQRETDIANLSVCNVPVSDENGLTYGH